MIAGAAKRRHSGRAPRHRQGGRARGVSGASGQARWGGRGLRAEPIGARIRDARRARKTRGAQREVRLLAMPAHSAQWKIVDPERRRPVNT